MKNHQTRHQLNTAGIAILGIPGLLTIITLLSGIVLASPKGHADTTKSEASAVSVTVNSACTLMGGSAGTSTSGGSVYSATIEPGTTGTISGSKLTTICNDPSGYSLYAIGYGNDAYDTPTNTQMIGGTSGSNISTSTTTGGDSSSWAMKLAQVTSGAPEILNSFNNWHVIPETYTQVAKYTSTTTDTPSASTGSQVQASYQVYIASAQAADTYTGKVKYTIVHPNTAAAPTTKTIANSTTMQEVSECPSTLTTGMVYQLTDNRDNQTYLVARLKDGNCWMLQNLKLGRTVTSSNTPLTLTPTNSDVGSNYTLNYTDIPSGGKFHAYTIDGTAGQNNSSEYYCTGDGTATTAYESCYYNWYTATAGTGTTYVATRGTSVNNSICPAHWTLPTPSQFSALYAQYNSAAQMEVDNPTTTKENSLTVGTVTSTPGFLLSGYYSTGGANLLGSRGNYWSRTAYSAQNGYDLNMYTSSVYPAYYNDKHNGFAVRCVLQ